MLELLNKISWCVSIALWLAMAMIIFGREFSEGGFIFGFIIWALIKRFVLGEEYIKTQIELKSSHKIEQTSVKNTEKTSQTTQEEIRIEKEWEKVSKPVPTYVAHEDIHAKKQTPKKSKEARIFEKFFAENLLAKVWWILIFLGAVFFMSLIYTAVWPITKLIIWFIIWGTIYLVWVWLNTKWCREESRISLWVSLLINYLVILAWKYILGWEICQQEVWWACFYEWVLTSSVTFLLLILNTILAVLTSLKYDSRWLLIFAFVAAYLNPFLLWESSEAPYTLLWYSMIVTLWALYVAYRKKDEILFPLAFVFSALICLIAPWSDASWWITKIMYMNILWGLAIYCCHVFKEKYAFIFEFLIWAVFFGIGLLWLLWWEVMGIREFLIASSSSLLLMVFCYLHIEKGTYFYSLWTLWAITTLTPIMILSGLEAWFENWYLMILGAFLATNIWVLLYYPLKSISRDVSHIVTGVVSGSLFATLMVYLYTNLHFTVEIIGYSFFCLSLVYACASYITLQRIGWFSQLQKKENSENLLYTFLSVAIALFSFSIAFIFSDTPEIISIIWLFEATVLFYISQRISSFKVALWWLVLFIVWVIQFVDFINLESLFWLEEIENFYGMIGTLCIVSVSLVWNLFFLFPKKWTLSKLPIELYGFHNIFHIIASTTIIFAVWELLQIEDPWISLLYLSTVMTTIWVIYNLISSPFLQYFHLASYIVLIWIHIIIFAISSDTGDMNLSISSLIVAIHALPYIYEYFQQKKIQNMKLFSVFLLYVFILSTQYVYHIFDVTFAITIYWGILAFILLWYGIKEDILPMRTIWLYIISLTATKIFFYDIWMSVDDTISRVAALMIVWILMMVLSTMYTRKYGNNLNAEFNASNIFWEWTNTKTEKAKKLIWDIEQDHVKVEK